MENIIPLYTAQWATYLKLTNRRLGVVAFPLIQRAVNHDGHKTGHYELTAVRPKTHGHEGCTRGRREGKDFSFLVFSQETPINSFAAAGFFSLCRGGFVFNSPLSLPFLPPGKFGRGSLSRCLRQAGDPSAVR
jgi:hypothetical protein